MASSSQQQTRWKCGRFKPVLTSDDQLGKRLFATSASLLG
jgi:hypothetical protein